MVEQHVPDNLWGTRRMKAQNQILLDRCMTEPLNMAVVSSAPSILETADHDQRARRPTVQDSSSMWFSCTEDRTAASASSFFSFSFWLYSQGRHIWVLNGSPPSFYSFILCVFSPLFLPKLSFHFVSLQQSHASSAPAAHFRAPCHWPAVTQTLPFSTLPKLWCCFLKNMHIPLLCPRLMMSAVDWLRVLVEGCVWLSECESPQ